MSRIRIAIVGVNFGRHIVAHLSDPNKAAHGLIELAAVCDRDAARANTVARTAGVRATTDLDELLADPTIDAIGLFTGPIGRADLIRRIVRAGKHVMTTKPFELDPDRALEVLLEAQRLGRAVHMNSPSPVMPADLQQIQDWRAKYDLGHPVACRRDVWASYREPADDTWYDDPDQCPVAPIFRLGIYAINDMIRLLGEAESVQVIHSRIFTGRPTPDNAQLGILFKNGVIGNVFASFGIDDGHHYSNAMTLNFERGTINRNVGISLPGRSRPQTRMDLVAKVGEDQFTTESIELDDASGNYQWGEFAQAVRAKRPTTDHIMPEQIVAGLRVIAAMRRAEQSGKTERV